MNFIGYFLRFAQKLWNFWPLLCHFLREFCLSFVFLLRWSFVLAVKFCLCFGCVMNYWFLFYLCSKTLNVSAFALPFVCANFGCLLCFYCDCAFVFAVKFCLGLSGILDYILIFAPNFTFLAYEFWSSEVPFLLVVLFFSWIARKFT